MRVDWALISFPQYLLIIIKIAYYKLSATVVPLVGELSGTHLPIWLQRAALYR